MAEVAAAAMIVSTVMQAAGQYQAGQESAAWADYNKQVAQTNAGIADQTATYNEQVSNQKYAQEKKLLQKDFEEQQAWRRARGYSEDVLTQAAADHEANLLSLNYSMDLETQQIRYEGQLGAYGYQNDASAYGAQSRSASQSAPWAAGGTLLSGGAEAFGTYKKMGGSWDPFKKKAPPSGAGARNKTAR